jgi:hypothetical protein
MMMLAIDLRPFHLTQHRSVSIFDHARVRPDDCVHSLLAFLLARTFAWLSRRCRIVGTRFVSCTFILIRCVTSLYHSFIHSFICFLTSLINQFIRRAIDAPFYRSHMSNQSPSSIHHVRDSTLRTRADISIHLHACHCTVYPHTHSTRRAKPA